MKTCCKNKLEEIARTKERKELSYKVQTGYSECTSCGQIYETTHVNSRAGKRISATTRQYTGLLNRNLLMDYAQRYSGEMTASDEECIYLDIPLNKD